MSAIKPNRNSIEIMAPVGSWESLSSALNSGSNSVYFGIQGLNMRSSSSVNFSLEDLSTIVERCRDQDIKSYLTLNTVLYDKDLSYMREVLNRARQERISAVIVSDQAAMIEARALGLEVHLSTQLNISNIESVLFYSRWADVVVLARELTLMDVRYIYDEIRSRNIVGPSGRLIKIEMFIHGALCMAVSGKCYLSLHESWKSANRGSCGQMCRRQYKVTDIETNNSLVVDNQYIMSPKDLCTIEFLEEILSSGVEILKIEGRARGAEYVATVCRAYNQALEYIIEEDYTREKAELLETDLRRVFNRGFWGGYYLGHKIGNEFGQWTQSYGSSATEKKVYVGKVTNFFTKLNVAEILIEASPLSVGDKLLFMGNTTGALEMPLTTMFNEGGIDIITVVQGEKCSVKLDDNNMVRRGDKLYKLVSVV